MVPVNQMQIQVLGEVKTPMIYNIPDGSSASLTSVVAAAGGLTADANLKAITVLHHTVDGKTTSTTYNFNSLLTSGSDAVTVQSGDILYVPTRHKGNSGLNVLQTIGPFGWLIH
jgi:protein involved in polysaccharide export with SLBB domain